MSRPLVTFVLSLAAVTAAAATAVVAATAVDTATAGAARAAGEVQAFAQIEPRAMTRVVFFGDGGLKGEYSIQYGKPVWKPEYDKDFEKMTRGKRMRLGRDWWTTLDTFSPLTFGEKTELAEGSWFLALDCSEKDEWSLVALDPAPIRKAHMDAFGTEKVTGGTRLPMTYEKVEEDQADLLIQFLADPAKSAEQTLEIRFGKHKLTTKVVAKR